MVRSDPNDLLVAGTPEQKDIIVPTENVSALGTGDVFEDADTQRIISTSAIVKYVNLLFGLTIKETAPADPGFYEYAIFVQEEQTASPVMDALFTSNNGTQSIGDIATNLYRDKCLWSGCVPVSATVPNGFSLMIKIPPKFQKWKRGRYLNLVALYRSRDSTDSTSVMKIMYQQNFKCYT